MEGLIDFVLAGGFVEEDMVGTSRPEDLDSFAAAAQNSTVNEREPRLRRTRLL